MVSFKTTYKSTFVSLLLLLAACSQQSGPSVTQQDTLNDSPSYVLSLNNTFFILPSPQQTLTVIEKNKFDYKPELINPSGNLSNYSTKIRKSLNLGVYGTDLGYLTIYDRLQETYNYLNAINKLTDELDISDVLNNETLHRIEKNIGNKDSLTYYISDLYRKSDAYLKDNERNETAVLIVAGGWIESMYLVSNYYVDDNSPELFNQLGFQKFPLDNLIKLLSPYYNNSPEFTSLIDDLVDLAYEFDVLDFTYTYQTPQTDTVKRLTVIKSKSEISIPASHLLRIAEKVKSIRNKITR